MFNENGVSFDWGESPDNVELTGKDFFGEDDEEETASETQEENSESNEENEQGGYENETKFIDNVKEYFDDDESEDSNEEVEESDESEGQDADYSDFLTYLKENSIPEIEDEQIKNCKTADDLSEIIQSVVEKRLDDETKAIRDSQNAGVDYTELNTAKNNLDFLNVRKDEIISAEGEEADAMRKNLLLYYFNIKGYDKDVAEAEVADIFEDGKEIDKLKRFLPEMVRFNEAKIKDFNRRIEENLENQKKQQEEELGKFKKEILEEKTAFGDLDINAETKKKIFEYATKPAHKDPNNPKQFYTELDWQIKQNPFEWKKLMALVGVITDGGKNLNNIAKMMANKEVKKEYKNIANSLKNGNFRNGSMKLTGEYDSKGRKKYNSKGQELVY